MGAFWHSVRHARPLAVGLNCALGAALMRPYIEELAKVAGDTFISCYPNAGLPNPMSETGFDETPEVTGSLMEEFARSGFLNIAGRLLRHHARAHRRDRAARVSLPPARPARPAVHGVAGGLRACEISPHTRSFAPKGATQSLQMLAVARATAVLCALIGTLWNARSGAPEYFTSSEPIPVRAELVEALRRAQGDPSTGSGRTVLLE